MVSSKRQKEDYKMKNEISFYNSVTKKTETLYNFKSVDLMLNDADEWVYRVLCDTRYYYFSRLYWLITGIEVY